MADTPDDVATALARLASKASLTDSPAARAHAAAMLRDGSSENAAELIRAALALNEMLDEFSALPVGVEDERVLRLLPFKRTTPTSTVASLLGAWRSVPHRTLPARWTMSPLTDASDSQGDRVKFQVRDNSGSLIGSFEIHGSAVAMARGNLHLAIRAEKRSPTTIAIETLLDRLGHAIQEDASHERHKAARLACCLVVPVALRTFVGCAEEIVDDARRAPVDAAIDATTQAIRMVHAMASSLRPDGRFNAYVDVGTRSIHLAFSMDPTNGILFAKPPIPDHVRRMIVGRVAVASANGRTSAGFVSIDLRDGFEHHVRRTDGPPSEIAALIRSYGTDGSEIAAAIDAAVAASSSTRPNP